MNNLPPAILAIKRLLGITDEQARAIMPGDDMSILGFPGVQISPEDDSETWAEREHRRDVEEFYKEHRDA